jgi:imidazole glycerol-phosphate synthase subunit HisF
MLKNRLIACLLIRDGLIVQSVNFNRYLPIGRPKFPIEFVTQWDVDEIILLDMSAGKENRGPSLEVLEMLSITCTVPLTVGGGIQSVEMARDVIRSGADKISINLAALENKTLITDLARQFGSQCVVVSMDCRKQKDGKYYVFSSSGQKNCALEASDWAAEVEKLGAGEIFLNSIDRDGSRLGYDLDLISSVTSVVNIPVIACGGAGSYKDFSPGILKAGADAVAAANIFHHVEHSTILAKACLLDDGVNVRLDSQARYDNRRFDKFGRLLMLDSGRLDIESKEYSDQ